MFVLGNDYCLCGDSPRITSCCFVSSWSIEKPGNALQAAKIYTFRRGTSHAHINCLAFSAEGISPPLLACASSHGTVHVWVLSDHATAPSASLLSSVIPPSMTDIMDPKRSATSFRVPSGVPSICAIQVKTDPELPLTRFCCCMLCWWLVPLQCACLEQTLEMSAQTKKMLAASQILESNASSMDSDFQKVTLLVATESAVLYTYQIQHLERTATPAFVLEDECHLLSYGNS